MSTSKIPSSADASYGSVASVVDATTGSVESSKSVSVAVPASAVESSVSRAARRACFLA